MKQKEQKADSLKVSASSSSSANGTPRNGSNSDLTQPLKSEKQPSFGNDNTASSAETSSSTTSNINVHKRLRLVKDSHSFSNYKQILPEKGMISKKSVNIPLCDVRIDEDYNDNVTASYNLPISYVKHVKNLSEETDITIDYHAEPEDEIWITNLNSKFNFSEPLTVNKFEQFFNILEKTNGTSRDSISQPIALKALLDKSGCDTTFIYKISNDLFRYWLSKREKTGKPLVRKYWPPVLASDTNPHQVFRLRDKERYRLRRHRRNDLDSFRYVLMFFWFSYELLFISFPFVSFYPFIGKCNNFEKSFYKQNQFYS
jgi:hypothetical protein